MPARVVEDSHGGVRVPQGDGAALGSAVVSLLEDDARRASLGSAGLAWVSAGHTWVDVASTMLEGIAE
jgi:glycosyltransferase involved in cell wall biosynthesis